MRSKRTKQFHKLFAQLPSQVQQDAIEAYQIFRSNPYHPSLHFLITLGIEDALYDLFSASVLLRPDTISYLGHIFEMGAYKGRVLGKQIITFSDQCRCSFLHTWCPAQCLDTEMVAAHFIEHNHVERRGRSSFFDKTTNMEKLDIESSMHKLVNRSWIAMKGKHDRFQGCSRLHLLLYLNGGRRGLGACR